MAKNFNESLSYIKEIDFMPTSLEKIQENKYGCVRDLVAMFLAYAKVAGLKDVYPALILTPSDRFTNIQTKYALDDEINKLRFVQSERKREKNVLGFNHEDIEDEQIGYRIRNTFKKKTYKKIYEQIDIENA